MPLTVTADETGVKVAPEPGYLLITSQTADRVVIEAVQWRQVTEDDCQRRSHKHRKTCKRRNHDRCR